MNLLTKSIKFEAHHVLRHHKGKCSRDHGHSWKVLCTFQVPDIDEQTGMSVDFYELGQFMKYIFEMVDHRSLNDVVHREDPTSERLANWIGDRWRNFGSEALVEVFLSKIEVWETDSCLFTWIPESPIYCSSKEKA